MTGKKKLGLHLTVQRQLFYNGDFEKVRVFKYFEPEEIALISIGMWNSHSCRAATKRMYEIAPKTNKFLSKMRDFGCHIIHGGSYSNYQCKSGSWGDTDLRKNIKGKKMHPLIDKGLNIPVLPFDDSDGGYKAEDKNYQYDKTTVSLNPEIKVDYKKDCISNYAKEILNYLHHHKVKVILIFGAHSNMCVLDKPYGLKFYLRYGFPSIIVEDICDTMYNQKMKPYVTQKESNSLMTDWFQKHICPTINSEEIIDLSQKTYYVDIDETLTDSSNYESGSLDKDLGVLMNKKYEEGCNVVYYTSRGSVSGKDWHDYTRAQLHGWGIKYTLLMANKPFYDVFVDDKSINLNPGGLSKSKRFLS